jgi:hypothetical protein
VRVLLGTRAAFALADDEINGPKCGLAIHYVEERDIPHAPERAWTREIDV